MEMMSKTSLNRYGIKPNCILIRKRYHVVPIEPQPDVAVDPKTSILTPTLTLVNPFDASGP